jgi:hypothetical protein
MLNTDGDAETGDINGADYLLFWDSKTFGSDVAALARAAGRSPRTPPASSSCST